MQRFKFLIESFLYPIRICQLLNRVFFLQHFYNLQDTCHEEYSSNHPTHNILVPTNGICDQYAAKYKEAIANKCSDTNSQNINVIMVLSGLKYFFCKQNRTPPKPKWYLSRAYCTHRGAKNILWKGTTQHDILMDTRM